MTLETMFLVYLDLTAAFETVDNSFPLDQLQHQEGISGSTREGFRPCLVCGISFHCEADDSQIYVHLSKRLFSPKGHFCPVWRK